MTFLEYIKTDLLKTIHEYTGVTLTFTIKDESYVKDVEDYYTFSDAFPDPSWIPCTNVNGLLNYVYRFVNLFASTPKAGIKFVAYDAFGYGISCNTPIDNVKELQLKQYRVKELNVANSVSPVYAYIPA